MTAARGQQSPRSVLFSLTFASSAIVLADAVLPVLSAKIQDTAHLGLGPLGWIGSAYSLAMGVLVLPSMYAVRRIGHRGTLALGLVVFAAGTLTFALGASYTTLLAGRVIQGAATGLVSPTILACMRRLFTGEGRSRAISVWSGVSSSMLAVGPLAAAAVGRILDWRSVFAILAFLTFAAAVSVWRSVPSGAAARERPDLRTLLLGSGAFAAFDLSLMARRPEPAVALVLATIGVFAWLGARHSPTFISRQFSTGAVISLMTSGLLSSVVFLVPVYLETVVRLSSLEAATAMVVLTSPFLVVSPIAGRVCARFGGMVPITVGALALAVALVDATRWSAHSSLAGVAPTLALAGLGFGSLMAPATTIALSGVPGGRTGEGAVKLASARTLGVGVGVWGTGIMISRAPSCSSLVHVCLDAVSRPMLRPFALDAFVAIALAIVPLVLLRGRARIPRRPAA